MSSTPNPEILELDDGINSQAFSVFEELTCPLKEFDSPVELRDSQAYGRYLLMHKVIVGRSGAETLIDIYSELKDEDLPDYLIAGGWAAAEASLIADDISTEDRQDLLDGSFECWRKALQTQRQINANGPKELIQDEVPYRAALDLATHPLLVSMVSDEVSEKVLEDVFRDCLNLAQLNAIMVEIASMNRDVDALGAHVGLGYEFNAILALNRLMDPSWFAMPTIARADTGIHHRKQTHDLLVMQRRKDKTYRAIPVEIKSSISKKDKNRYEALLVRGKMHLSNQGQYRPIDTLKAIAAVYEGCASDQDTDLVARVTDNLLTMIQDYCSGEILEWVSAKRTLTEFRDRSLVTERHPGLRIVS